MEDELRSRHLEEMATLLTHNEEDIDYDELVNLTKNTSTPSFPSNNPKTVEKNQEKKPSKAQKRRVRPDITRI